MGYEIDGNDLESTYDIHVIEVRGFADFHKRKGITSHNWLDEDGEEEFTDEDDIKFEARDIILDCYIKTTNRNDFFQKLEALMTILQSAGLHTLKLPYLSTTFNIYFKAGAKINIQTKWAKEVGHYVVGTFTLKLREPHPQTTGY